MVVPEQLSIAGWADTDPLKDDGVEVYKLHKGHTDWRDNAL